MVIYKKQLNYLLDIEKTKFLDSMDSQIDITKENKIKALNFALKYNITNYGDLERFILLYHNNFSLFKENPSWLIDILTWPDITGNEKLNMLYSKIHNDLPNE